MVSRFRKLRLLCRFFKRYQNIAQQVPIADIEFPTIGSGFMQAKVMATDTLLGRYTLFGSLEFFCPD